MRAVEEEKHRVSREIKISCCISGRKGVNMCSCMYFKGMSAAFLFREQEAHKAMFP